MITGKRLTALTAVLMAVAVALTGTMVVLAHTSGSSSVSASAGLSYASNLFDKEGIMTIDISVNEDDWNSMLENAMNEEYITCDITVNGTAYSSVGIRPKGNSSLTTMAASDSDRYSFKVEFDHYITGQTCQGLDKLVLNNAQSDATYMKEYLAYDMMSFMGVTSSLYSFANITVNGEAWGTYLALEAVEDSFALRNYGSAHGQIYKPEGNDMGDGKEMGGDGGEAPQAGGFPGNGFEPGGQQDSAASSESAEQDSGTSSDQSGTQGKQNSGNLPGQPNGGGAAGGQNSGGQSGDGTQGGQNGEGFPDPSNGNAAGGPPGMMGGTQPPGQDGTAQGQQPPDMGQMPPDVGTGGQMPGQGDGNPPQNGGGQFPDDGGGLPQQGDDSTSSSPVTPGEGGEAGGMPDLPDMQDGFPGQMGGWMPGSSSGGGSDLVYTDDDPDSYSDIFDNSVFDANQSDYQKVITALKALGDGSELEKYIDVDQVLRYFAVNTVLVNFDSYVGVMKHNYYLTESNGQLSILPWDFNLAFAGFQGNSADSAVNSPIDSPTESIDLSQRPLIGKLLEVDEYKQLYHAYLQQIVTEYFDSGVFENKIRSLDNLIGESVKSDPTALYTYDEYTTAVETLLQFGSLRAQSIQGQLDGSIPSTTDGQQQDPDALVDASGVSIAAMGSQGGGMGGGFGGDRDQAGENAPSGENGGVGGAAGIDRETLEQIMSILGDSTDGTLTEEQREQLGALGITDEMIEQFQSRAAGAMQNGMPQDGAGGMGGFPGGQDRQGGSRQGAGISASSVCAVAGCAAAAVLGVIAVFIFPRRRFKKAT